MRIAVIGSGISGLASAYLLSQKYDVTLLEKDDRIGGHSNTVDVETPDGRLPVDTGFIVYNQLNYPNLTGMFDHLGVVTKSTDMSFGISIGEGRCEYEGSLKGLMAQPANLLKLSYWSMLFDLVRFYKTAVRHVENGPEGENLGAFIERERYGRPFIDDHLLPMAAAIWSCPAETMMAFPARSFIKFMDNHQLLNFIERPQWRTVSGGSREYVRKITAALGARVRTGVEITGIKRSSGGVMVAIKGEGEVYYDKVVMAAHADQSLAMISDATEEEERVIGAFDFQPNHVILHSDKRLMPKRKAAWASWSYLKSEGVEEGNDLAVTYWMNRLQTLATKMPVLVTLNPTIAPDPDLIQGEYFYDHPVFDDKAIKAQGELPALQGKNGLYFCGAWTRYGFHEDGLMSAVAMAKSLGIEIPWDSPTPSYGLHVDGDDGQDEGRKLA